MTETDGIAIINIKPLGFQWETSDPFLFCVHHEDFYPKGNAEMGPDDSMNGRNIGQDFTIKDGYRMYHGAKVPGFPAHPHRGFETVTILKNGIIDHSDSMGASSRYGKGDVQWMTAGKGVMHSEMFPLIHQEKDNPLELFQVWLNLPKKNKMVSPYFKMLWRNTIPIIEKVDKEGITTKIELISGEFQSEKAAAPPPDSWAFEEENKVVILHIIIPAGGEFTLPKSERGVNRTLFFYKGEDLRILGEDIPPYHAVELNPEFDVEIANNGNLEAKLLLLQGKPIGEPIAQHGPFVMNTQEEIQTAFAEYRQNEFGGWPWDNMEQVHDRTSGRFAIHGDGSKEIPEG